MTTALPVARALLAVARLGFAVARLVPVRVFYLVALWGCFGIARLPVGPQGVWWVPAVWGGAGLFGFLFEWNGHATRRAMVAEVLRSSLRGTALLAGMVFLPVPYVLWYMALLSLILVRLTRCEREAIGEQYRALRAVGQPTVSRLPAELIASEAPPGRGTEMEAGEAPAGRGTELEAAPHPGGRGVGVPSRPA
ncbi:MAG: hypothetical protein HY321_06615 [Armatimonadetes bacterium]|nr:hypothetical protein [Armatimonadota bacterium]